MKNGIMRGLNISLVLAFLALAERPAGAAAVIQDFYVPLPEAQVYQANNTIVAGTGSSILSTISIHVVQDGTVIYYDQWEDGYEISPGAPAQSTTQIWGDGNDAHGIPPGLAHNPNGLAAGTIITLTNVVVTQPRNPAVIQYDGRDHISTTKPIVVTRAHWPSTTGTVIAGCVSVLDTAQWGTNYVSPIGQNMTNGLMQYVGMFVQAAQNNTVVTIDPTGTNGVGGAGVTNFVLNQGESYLYNGGITNGARVTSSLPVQADLVIGHKNATYAVDWFTLYPQSSWGANYYTPVSSSANGYPAYVYLYNPNSTNINVKTTTKTGVTSVTVPARGNYQFTMPVASGASFISTNGAPIYAVCTVNATPAADTTYNWGFSLVPTGVLSTETDLGWAPGSSDGTQNGSPVWVTALGATTIYVVYGDGTRFLTNSAGLQYSTNFTMVPYQSLQIFDSTKTQTGMKIYTLDGTLITAAWGESADASQAGNPFIDAGYTVLPFPVPSLTKSVANLSNPGLGARTNGTLLQYTVTVANKFPIPLIGVPIYDTPTPALKYVANSTTNYNFTAQTTNRLADNVAGNPFPLAYPGYTNAVIAANTSVTFTYQFTVTNINMVISNNAVIPSGVSGLTTPLQAHTALPTNTVVPPVINFTDTNGLATNSYAVGQTNIYITVTNAAANLATNTLDTIQVTVLDTITGDSQLVTLTETGTNTGVFRNITALPTSSTTGLYANDGILNGSGGDPLTVTYIDNTGSSYTASATLTGSSGGGGSGGSGGGGGSTSTLTKQLYLFSTNGINQALSRFNTSFSGGTTSNSVDIGNAASSLGTIGVDTISSNVPNSSTFASSVHGGANAFMLVGLSFAKINTGMVTNVYLIGTNSSSSGKFTNVMTLVGTNLQSSSPGCAAIYELVNPPVGTNYISITSSNNGTALSTLMAGAVVFTNVNLSNPLSITNKNNRTSINPSNVVASAVGEVVFDVMSVDTAVPSALGSAQTKVFMGLGSGAKESGGCSFQVATRSSVTNSWTNSATAAQNWADIAVSIKPAATGIGVTGPGTNRTLFVQTPAFNAPFVLPAGGLISVTNFITLTNGSFGANPDVTATLQTNGVDFLTLGSPTFNSGVGVNTNLVWTGSVASAITNPAGAAITYVISNNVSGTAFHVNYGSSSMPSVLLLPASSATVISVNNLGIYDAPYPVGSSVSGPVAGTPLYVRATVSDPFGNYDISSVKLVITDPNGGVTTNNAIVVATTTTNAVYEFVMTATSLVGNYSLAVIANEGTEGISDSATATLTTTYLDLGTPNTTSFTSGNNGATTNGYPLNNGSACLLVQDLSANTDTKVANTVVATVSSSAGGSIQVTLIETGTNTGSFANCFNTTTNQSSTNSSTLYAPVGAVLTANYTSVPSPAYSSSATATIQPLPGLPPAPALALYKTVTSPSGGQVVVGQSVIYNVVVYNTGNTNLYNVAITDSYPAQLTFTSASLAPDVTNLTSRLVVWSNLGTLAPGQSTNLTVTLNATNSGSATNLAWATSTSVGTVPSTNTATVTINKTGLTVTKTLLTGAATNVVGSTVVFQIAITNTGTTTIPTLPLEDYYSGASFQYVSNSITSTNAAAISGYLPATGYGSLIWTNLAPANGLAPNGVITLNVTNRVVGQGYPANNTATVDYAVDSLTNAVPVVTSSVGVTNAAATISGHVYFDPGTNRTGTTGLGGVVVQLYTTNTGSSVLVGYATTAADGSYQFGNLGTNNYQVVQSLPSGYAATSNLVTVVTNALAAIAYTNVNFYDYLPPVYYSVSGSVTNDLNWNGTNNIGEPGLANVTINLIQDLNSNGLVNAGEPVAASAVTDTNGNYSFTYLPAGRYVIQEVVPFGYYATNVAWITNNYVAFMAATNLTGRVTNFTQIGLNLTNNSTLNNFLVGGYYLSGNVYDDTNGLTDGSVGGFGTNGNSTLYVNLLDASSNVVQTVTVASNGSYAITNLISGTYWLQLSTIAGPVGLPAPATVPPAGWGNTGSSTNLPTTITGNTNGLMSIQLGTFLTTANFGLDQLPVGVATNATYLNPGGTTTLAVPALTGTDGEQGPLAGTTNKIQLVTPANGTLYYNGVTVTSGQLITNYNPALLVVDPTFEGAGTITISFNIFDLAGKMSAATADATVTITGVSLSGTVYDDRNGLVNGLVDGTATNAVGVPLYVNLLNASSNVLASVAVGTNGSYTFPSISSGSGYVELSTVAGTVGSPAPAMTLPSGWVNVGGSTNGVVAGNTNGVVPVTVLAANVASVNFGVDQLPVAVAASSSVMNPGTNSVVTMPALTGTDFEQGPLAGATNTVQIVTLPGNGTLYYSGVAVTAGQMITNYNPASLTVDPAFEGAGTITISFNIFDLAGKMSAATASATLAINGVSLSGTVYTDLNGLVDGLVNGTATNGVGMPLYANLLNASSNVLASVAVGTNGTYTFASISSGTVYVELSTNAGNVGFAAPAMGLPAGWVHTGESINGVIAGNTNGVIPVTVVSANVSNANFGLSQIGSISGQVEVDVNGNGVVDLADTNGLSGLAISIYNGATLVATTTTSANGAYTVTNLPPGSYTVTATVPAGYTNTTASSLNVPLNSGQALVGNSFLDSQYAVIGDFVWRDNNGNGIQDSSEPGLAAVTVALYRTNNGAGTLTSVATTSTSGSGIYTFTNVVPSTNGYVVLFSTPSGYQTTLLNAGGDTTKDSDANLVSGKSAPFVLTTGQTNNTLDAGYYQVASVAGTVLVDVNGNGVPEANDTNGLAGVLITLQTNGVTVLTTTTDSSGNYAFPNLAPGSYTVVETVPTNYTNTTTKTLSVTLTTAQNSTGNNYLDTQYGVIGDYVWVDANGNGIQDSETGLAGVSVVLYQTNNGTGSLTALATNLSTAGGAYTFTNVLPSTNNYVVSFGLPAGYYYAPQTVGGNTNLDSNPGTNNGLTAAFAVTTGQTNNAVDAGYVPLATIGDFVFADANNNGVYDSGTESGINGVTVQLWNANGLVASTSTATLGGVAGSYTFNVQAGMYYVKIAAPPAADPLNSMVTPTGNNNDNGYQPAGAGGAITNAYFTVTPGQTNNAQDIGLVPATSLVALGNRVFLDVNGDGTFNGSDSGASQVTIELYTNGQTAEVSTPVATVDTDSSGYYYFDNLLPGTYFVHIPAHEFQAGGHITGATAETITGTADNQNHGLYAATPATSGISSANVALAVGTQPTAEGTTNYTGTVPDANNNFQMDLGVVPNASQVLIGDTVFLDTNNNGVQDAGETGINGVGVELWQVVGGATNLIATTVTATDGGNAGTYQFVTIPGTFLVKIPATNFNAGGPLAATPLASSVVNLSVANNNIGTQPGGLGTVTVAAATITLAGGQNNFAQDFGFTAPVTIGNFVWVDTNGNGIQDDGEPGLAGVQVILYQTNSGLGTLTGVATNTTITGGAYSFTNVPPGTNYVVGFSLPSGYVRIAPYQGGNTNLDSDASVAGGYSAVLTLTSGQTNNTVDAGYYQTASVSGTVKVDVNGNGVAEVPDTNGLNAVTISVYSGGILVTSTNTDVNGAYTILNLPPGSYTVVQSVPTGYTNTTTNTLSVTLASAQNSTGNNYLDTQYAAIGDFVWRDNNGNGIQDGDEPGLAAVPVTLYQTNNGAGTLTALVTNYSSATGIYSFTNVVPSTNGYVVGFGFPSGYTVYTTPFAGGDSNLDSDANPANGKSAPLVLTTGLVNNTLDAGYYKYASVAGTVLVDVNGNGVTEAPDTNGLAGVLITLQTNGVTMLTTNTDSSGNYAFLNLPPGSYTVVQSVPTGYTNTTTKSLSVTLTTAQNSTGNNYLDTQYGVIGDYVWVDANGNGIQDGEAGLANVSVVLYQTNNGTGSLTALATNLSTAGGAYMFTNVLPSTNGYVVSFGLPGGYVHTAPYQGADTNLDSDASVAAGYSAVVTLTTGVTNNTVDAGYYQYASVAGSVKVDVNGNGVADGADTTGLTAVLITLQTNGVTMLTTNTDGSGNYAFPNLPPGSYTVVQSVPAGYTNTTPVSLSVTLASGQNSTGNNYLDTQPVSIGDYVWVDTNGNGLQDGDEAGLAGVSVVLYRTNSGLGTVTAVATNTTSGSGAYGFSGLLPGDFVVGFGPAGGYVHTTPYQGTDITLDSNARISDGLSEPFTLSTGQSTTTVDAGYYALAALSGRVLVDVNGNGTPDAPDTNGLASVLITLQLNGATVLTTNTDSSGNYAFANLPPGNYTVIETDPAGYLSTGDTQGANDNQIAVTLTSGQNATGNNFLDSLPVQLSGRVLLDVNGNGVADTGDTTGLADVLITLQRNGSTILTTNTDSSGNYAFANLLPGDYTIIETDKAGYISTADTQGANDNHIALSLTSGQTSTGNNFLDSQPVSIGDLVWVDTNGNGIQDGSETGLAGVQVILYQTNSGLGTLTAVLTNTSSSLGAYAFTGLTPGSYVVGFNPPSGYTRSAPYQGTDTTLDSNAQRDTGLSEPITLTTGQTDNSIDAGFYQPVTIGNYTWLDINGNGIQDSGEPGLSGVTVVLYQTNAVTHDYTPVATNVSSSAGAYLFTNLVAGIYQLSFEAPVGGYLRTTPFQGSNSNLDSDMNASGLSPFFTMAAGTANLTLDAGFKPNPTAVSLVSMSVRQDQDQVWVTWQTYVEDGVLAFDLTRSTAGGDEQEVTPDLVWATGLDMGQTYRVLDATAPAGANTYHLYAYNNDGSVDEVATVNVTLASTATATSVQILGLQFNGTTAVLRWTGGQGPYVVEQSTSLGAEANWQPVGGTQTGTQMTVPLNGQTGFFRVRTGGN